MTKAINRQNERKRGAIKIWNRALNVEVIKIFFDSFTNRSTLNYSKRETINKTLSWSQKVQKLMSKAFWNKLFERKRKRWPQDWEFSKTCVMDPLTCTLTEIRFVHSQSENSLEFTGPWRTQIKTHQSIFGKIRIESTQSFAVSVEY